MNAQENWDDLRYFLALARHGSLSAAARHLKVNHTTVLRRVAALEAAVGVALFDRRPDGHTLTPAGEEMRRAASRVEEDLAAVSLQLSGLDTAIGGTVRMTTIDVLAEYILPRHIRRFRDLHPNIAVDVVVAEARLSLTKREADVAIRATRRPPEHLIGRAVANVAFAVYGATDYLDRHGITDTARPPDPGRHTWIALGEGFEHTRMVQWFERTVPANRVVYRVNTVAGLLPAVAVGMGLGLLPCGPADILPGLRRVGPVVTDVGGVVWVLTHADLRQKHRVRVFYDAMIDALVAERDLLEGRYGP